MAYIRKYAAQLSFMAALAAAIAAPYMIPENPDSAVFRNGTLGLILLLASAYPVRRAFQSVQKRQLIVSLPLGFFFALALSIGSELFVYKALLPGTGSLVRRIAVPLLATPLFGGLVCRLTQFTLPRKAPIRRASPWIFAIAIFLCWTPLLLAYFPGMLNYDFAGQYAQHTSGQYTNLHPLLHSVLCNGVITLGEVLHSRTFGVLLMSLLQMALFSLALGNSCAFAARHSAPVWALAALTALYAFHPVFSVMALSMTKDTLFAAALLTLSLLTWELLEDPTAFERNKSRCALYILCAVNTALMRNNGLFAIAAILPGVIIVLRSMRKLAVRLAVACAVACFAVSCTLNLFYSPESMPSFQLYSLPAQQLVRAYHLGNMTDEERSELEGWYTAPEGLKLHPHLADPAKGYLNHDRIEAEGERFLSLWRQVGARNLLTYAEAFLMLNVGSWYPDDLSHSTIYPDVSWNDKGYLQTQEYDMTEQGIVTSCYLPEVKALYERICRRNNHQEYPLISVLFCPAVPFWLLMLAYTLLAAKRKNHLFPAALGVFGLWLSYLFGPCTLPRYALPLFSLAPALLLAALTASQEELS